MRKYLPILSSLAFTGAALAQPAEPPAPVETPAPAPAPAPEAPKLEEPKPEPPKPEAQPSANVGYDKGFFIKSDDGKYLLKISGRVQPFYNLTRIEGPPKNVASFFEIRRARLVFEGNVHTKKLLYKFQSDFGKGFVTLKDFHADVELAPNVWIRGGQWKRPFSRQQITSSGKLEITDRAITDRVFGAGRDIGLALRNDYEKSPELEWTVGVFNGTGDGSTITSVTVVDPVTLEATTVTSLPTNVPREFKPALIGRIGINRGGIKGYSEGDLEGGPLRYAVASSIWLEGDLDDNDRSNQKIEIDGVMKRYGLALSGGAYALTDQDGESVFDAAKSLIGFHVQAGYMVVPKHWEVVGRYALANDLTTKSSSPRDQQEIAIGGDYYAFGHDAKVQFAFRMFKNADASFTDSVLFELGANVGF